MKKIASLVLIALFVFTIVSCDDTKTYAFDEANPLNNVYYQVFVRSFADSDGDGIGDLNGITENLSYFEDLGITALWLLPINPSPSYHGYDITDYYGINPDYGTMDDFDNLVDEANARGIDIVLDLVVNHTSDQHPWYINARSSTSSAYRDYYIWNGSTAYSFFEGGMMDLNFENPDVIDEIYNIVDFYLEKGVHGFRLDAAIHFYEGVTATIDNTLFLINLKAHMEANYPNTYVLPEVFVNSYDIIKDFYLGAGADSLFDFYVKGEILSKVGLGSSRSSFVDNLRRAYDAYASVDPNFIDAPILGNHDTDRIASENGFIDQPEKLALAARIQMTLPGNPFIYYGDELGMVGYRESADSGVEVPGYGTAYDEFRRLPFLWGGGSSYETTWFPDVSMNANTDTLATQLTDDASLYNAYREIIEIKRENPALMYGNYFEAFNLNNINVQGYVRYYQYEDYEQAVLVLHNLTPDAYTVEDIEFLSYLLGDSLTIDAYGTVILEIDADLIEDYI